MSASGTGRKRISWLRETRVGRSRDASGAMRMKWVRSGGSSTTFNSALPASRFRASASGRITTRVPPPWGRMESVSSRARTCPMRTNAPDFSTTTTSGWLLARIFLQEGQEPQGPCPPKRNSPAGASQLTAMAKAMAASRFPRPGSPVKSRLWGRLPESRMRERKPRTRF